MRYNYYFWLIFCQILHNSHIHMLQCASYTSRWSFTSICTICTMVMTLVRSYSHVALENGTSCAVSTQHLAGCFCLMLRRRLLANCVGTHRNARTAGSYRVVKWPPVFVNREYFKRVLIPLEFLREEAWL